MLVKTILNRIEKHSSFVYHGVRFREGGSAIEIEVRSRRGARPVCSGCSRRGSVYDTLGQREFQFVPLWGLAVFLLYSMRRVNCLPCGVRVESVPWAEGKRRTTISFEWFLAIWSKRLSWSEVSEIFGVSWETVFRSVERAVNWGRSHADYSGIEALGIDEIQWKYGQTYLTLVYQIDVHVRRLIWVGEERTQKTLHACFDWLGRADRRRQRSRGQRGTW